MNELLPPEPECAAGTDRTIEGERQRKRTRGLRSALALLEQARAIAGAESADDPEPGEPIE
jgi:hypothetical protein